MTQMMESPTSNLPARANGGGQQSALAAMAARYQISQDGLVDVIRKTCMTGNPTDAQFKAFILVANQYQLNPLTREIHAFTDPRRGIVPIVGIDGWSRIVNRQDDFDGCEFEHVDQNGDIGCTCSIFVKGRSKPVRLTEWLVECKRNTPPWQTMPRRMLRHKAFMQTARLAFSLSGIYDADEARDIVRNGPVSAADQTATDRFNARPTGRPVSEGQRFEPEPETVPPYDPETGEIIDATPEPDTRGADAEPADGPDVTTWATTCEALNGAAMDAELVEKELHARVNLWLVANGARGKEDRKTTPEQRRELVEAVRDGRLMPDGKVAPPAK